MGGTINLLKEIKMIGVVAPWTAIGITCKGYQFFRSNEKLMIKATGDLKPKKRRNHSDYKVLCDRCGYMTNVKAKHPEYLL